MKLTMLLARAMTALNAFLTTTIQEWLFVQGRSFSYEDYYILADDEVLDILLDPSAFSGDNLTVNPLLFAASSGPITIDFHASVDADDDGTVLQATNRRSGLPGPSVVLRENPTINDAGTRFAGDLVPSTGLNPATSSGSGNHQGLPFEPSSTTKTMMRIHNTDGNNTYFSVKMTWFEA